MSRRKIECVSMLYELGTGRIILSFTLRGPDGLRQLNRELPALTDRRLYKLLVWLKRQPWKHFEVLTTGWDCWIDLDAFYAQAYR